MEKLTIFFGVLVLLCKENTLTNLVVVLHRPYTTYVSH